VYEDDGKTIGYLANQYAWTTCAYTHNQATGVLTVKISTNGTFDSLPATRNYTVQLLNMLPAVSVGVSSAMDQEEVRIPHRASASLGAGSSSWHFDGEQVMTIVNLNSISTARATTVTIKLPNWPSTDRGLLNGMRGAIGLAKLAKLNLDEVRQNPGGQCCVTNITAPLSQAATWGSALTALAVQPDLTAFQTKLRGFWGMYAGAQLELENLPNKSATVGGFSGANGTSADVPPEPRTAPTISQRTHAVGDEVGSGDPEPIKLVRLMHSRDLLASAYITV
jgi:hypothetical protein